jgi:O-glycosyl hydrolase
MKLAEKLSPHKNLKWFGSTWSPPLWMKTNDSTGYYGLKGKPGEKYFKSLALYYVKYGILSIIISENIYWVVV